MAALAMVELIEGESGKVSGCPLMVGFHSILHMLTMFPSTELPKDR